MTTLLLPEQLTRTQRIDLLLSSGVACSADLRYIVVASQGRVKRGNPTRYMLFRDRSIIAQTRAHGTAEAVQKLTAQLDLRRRKWLARQEAARAAAARLGILQH